MIKEFFNKITENDFRKKVKKEKAKIYLKEKIKHFSLKNKNKRILSKQMSFNIAFSKQKQKIIYIFWFFVSLILWIFFLFWPIFKIEKINILPQDPLVDVNIWYKSIDYLRWKSIFFIDRLKLEKSFSNYQENIKKIEVEINLPNIVNIKVNSFNPVFQASIKWKKYFITSNWTIIPWKATLWKDLQNIDIILWEKESLKIFDYKKSFDEKNIENIFGLIKSFTDNLPKIKISNIKYFVLEREIHINIESWNIIILSLDSDIKEQIKKLTIFNKNKFDLEKKWIIYTDLRIKNKIFLCKIDNEYQCVYNLKKIYKNTIFNH